jgi:hypothetical protein
MIDFFFVVVNHSDRRLLLPSNTSRSTSPIPTSPNYHSITIPNEHRQSFYSPVPSIEGRTSMINFIQKERKKEKTRLL